MVAERSKDIHDSWISSCPITDVKLIGQTNNLSSLCTYPLSLGHSGGQRNAGDHYITILYFFSISPDSYKGIHLCVPSWVRDFPAF